MFAAGSFDPRRIVTAEGFERTFALYVLSRFLLADRLRPALDRAEAPIILNLCGTGGIPAGRIHWDDPHLARGYSLLRATMQGARITDLLGTGYAARHPDSRVRYVLYNPMFVDSGMHRQFRQPTRALVGAAAALLGSSTAAAADRLARLLDRPPTAPLTALRRGTPVPLTGAAFDPATAARLYAWLDAMVAGV